MKKTETPSCVESIKSFNFHPSIFTKKGTAFHGYLPGITHDVKNNNIGGADYKRENMDR